MTRWINTTLCLSLALTLVCVGCGKTGGKSDSKNGSKTGAANKQGHSHPTHGPHKGGLVELGDEEYHAEILNEEKEEMVIVYILDATAKKQVPIEAKEVIINLKHGGKPEQYKLPAVPDKDDPAGKSSRFQLKSGDAVHDLGHDDAEAKLTVKIKGKSYTGDIDHVHGSDGHKDEKTHKTEKTDKTKKTD